MEARRRPSAQNTRSAVGTPRGAVIALASALLVVLLVGGATIPLVAEALSYVIGFGVVFLFFAIRLLAFRWHDEKDRYFDFWGGMSETQEQLLERYRRPGANPILPPGGQASRPPLPDVAPAYGGHPVGRS